MEPTQSNKTQKKKDKKPIYILLGFFIFFILFIFLLTRPSLQSKAIEQLGTCSNTNDVKQLYDLYKFELIETDENGNKIVAIEFQNALRQKLNSFNLSQEEIQECLKWLPPTKANLNLIVIPDLSRRIIDNVNNPDQIRNDINILQTIWNTFREKTKINQDSKDSFIIDLTDKNQANGQFRIIADKLQFDLSSHKGKSNRLFFTQEKDKQFSDKINELYSFAKNRPLGADYKFYLRRHLSNRIKKNTLFESYNNKVILITDGYLETETSIDTKILGYQDVLRSSVNLGNTKQIITLKGLNIPKIDIDLTNVEILVCEVNERKEGEGYDFEILKAYWEDWFNRMGVDNNRFKFIQREQSSETTIRNVISFITK